MTFKKSALLVWLLVAWPLLCTAQTHEADTLIYEKHGKPRRLLPHWQAGLPADTFVVFQWNYELKNGDTVDAQQQQTQFVFQVDTVHADALSVSFYLGASAYRPFIESKDCPVTLNDTSLQRIQVRLSLRQPDAAPAVLNCAALQAFFNPLFRQNLECQRAQQKAGDRISTRVYEHSEALLDNCGYIRGMLLSELPLFNQVQGFLIPKKGRLRYKVTTRGDSDAKVIQYFVVEGQLLPNGNRQYSIMEDTTQAPPLEVRLLQEIGSMERFLKNKKEKPLIEAEDRTIIEVDPQYRPVSISRTSRSRLKRAGNDQLRYFEYRIERL
ncbi:MAG: hypothetical protein JNK89_08255 [Saprospiraceae bacterium]|nr:hypothetical protein [Saprospiraceae bacterium]